MKYKKGSICFAALFLLSCFLFSGCSPKVSDPSLFIVEDGDLVGYKGKYPAILEIPEGVTSVSKGFYHNSKIKEIIFPESCTYVGYSAFGGCSKLEKVTLPDNGIFLGRECFYECNKLKDITIPDSTSFGADVFSYTESNHSIVPCPIFFKINGEDQDSAIVHGLHFTDDGEFEIVFREYAVQIPVKFVDGKTVLQLVYEFEVSIITQDEEEVSPIEANIRLGKAGEDDVLLYSLKFDVDTIPKTIRCKRNGEFIDLNPVSWRPYEEWEQS